MTCRRNLVVLMAAFFLVMTAPGCAFYQKLKARDHLNKGVTAYEIKDYPKAEEHFDQAIKLDPELLHAWLYKAATYRVQVAPIPTAESRAMAHKAIKAFEDVLKIDSKNENALASIAGLYISPLEDKDMAREWQRKRLEANPQNPEPLYGIGTLDWQEAYEKTGQTGENVANLKPEERTELIAQVDDGIQALNQALEMRPEYTDAMQYLNLLYREKAKLASDPEEKRKWLREADGLALKALSVQRKLEEQAEKDRRMLKTSGGK
jgi:tetratricopeptide (TPR) repeat protein